MAYQMAMYNGNNENISKWKIMAWHEKKIMGSESVMA